VTDLPPNKAPTIRVTAMPADANPYGDIFGGWLMGQMDLAAGSVASRRSGGRAGTAAATPR
jgi:acyl-CoA thioesterase YciA